MAGDVFSLSASRLISYAVSMIGTMQLARFRSLTEFGTYSQMLLAINLFVSVFSLGLPYCLNYFLARAETKKERNTFLSTYYLINTIIGAFIGIVLMLAIPLIEKYFQNYDISNYWIFLAFFPLTMVITQSVENLLVVHKRSKQLAVYKIVHSFSVVFLITLVKILGWSFSTYVHLYLCSEACFMIAVYLFAIKLDGMFVFKINKQTLKSIVVFAVPLGLSIAAGTLKAETDKLVIGLFYSTEEYAVYANAAKELPLTFIATSITAVLLPMITKMLKNHDEPSAVSLWKETTTISFLINAFFAFGLFFFSKDAMTFLYSEKYISGATVFGIYSLVMLFRSTYFGMILQSCGKTKVILQASVSSLIINLILNFLLCKTIGFTGPAIATIISMIWNSGFQLFKSAKALNMSVKEIFPWKSTFCISAVNIILGIIFKLLQSILPLDQWMNNTAEAIILGLCWLVVYLIIFRKLIKEKIKILQKH